MPQIHPPSPPSDPVRLFRLAEMVALKLAEQHEGLRKEEALLRADIAWAKYARTAHLKLVERAKTCSKAKAVVEIARRRRIRTAQRLRLRLTAVIARKCGLMREAQARQRAAVSREAQARQRAAVSHEAQARQRAAVSKDERLLKVADLALSLIS